MCSYTSPMVAHNSYTSPLLLSLSYFSKLGGDYQRRHLATREYTLGSEKRIPKPQFTDAAPGRAAGAVLAELHESEVCHLPPADVAAAAVAVP